MINNKDKIAHFVYMLRSTSISFQTKLAPPLTTNFNEHTHILSKKIPVPFNSPCIPGKVHSYLILPDIVIL